MLLVDQDIRVTELAKNYIQDSCHIVYTTSYTNLAIEYKMFILSMPFQWGRKQAIREYNNYEVKTSM